MALDDLVGSNTQNGAIGGGSPLPGNLFFGNADLKQGSPRKVQRDFSGKVSNKGLFTTRQRRVRLNKGRYGKF